MNNLLQISYISFLLYNFYDFYNLFCRLQCFRSFFTVLVIFMFFNIVKNGLIQTPSRLQRFNISTKENFLSNKNSRSTPLIYGLGAKKPILEFVCTRTPCLGNKLCPYELIFLAHIEENSTDHFCFIKKIILTSWFGEIWKLRFLTLQSSSTARSKI